MNDETAHGGTGGGANGGGADRARLRAAFEAEARKSDDADIVLASSLIDNAVETALHVMDAPEPMLAPVVAAFGDGDVVEASGRLGDLVSAMRRGFRKSADADTREELRRVAGQLAWAKGALTACWSLADARQWYDAALKILQDDFWLRVEAAKFLLWTGEEVEARGVIAELLDLADEPDAVVTAFSQFGAIHEDRGDFEEALFHYQMAIEGQQRIVEAEPDNFHAGVDLVRARADIARLQEATGDAEAGYESRKAGLEVGRRLMAAVPGEALFVELYAGQLVDCALALRGSGRRDEAQAAYREVLSALAERPQPGPALRFLAGLAHEGMGDVHDEEGAAAAARDAWERARMLYLSCRDAAGGEDPQAQAARDKAAGRLAVVADKLGGGGAA